MILPLYRIFNRVDVIVPESILLDPGLEAGIQYGTMSRRQSLLRECTLLIEETNNTRQQLLLTLTNQINYVQA
jgi:hypothetical protein